MAVIEHTTAWNSRRILHFHNNSRSTQLTKWYRFGLGFLLYGSPSKFNRGTIPRVKMCSIKIALT